MKRDEILKAIEQKYDKLGVPVDAMLEGLLHSTPITYWDYIQTDALLGLQTPRTNQPDEMVFIMYHQVNELLFKMILWEIDQVAKPIKVSAEKFTMHLQRISRYFDMLCSSFTVMADGMEKEQYLKFRNTLTPASGFQSAQYRMLEIYATPMENLVHHTEREKYSNEDSIDELYEHIYWKKGATDKKTGEKTLTLKQFEYRYTPRLIRIANQVNGSTIYEKYLSLPKSYQENVTLIEALKSLDINANINWPLMHMGSAYRYLSKDKATVDATGGTNWKNYLPPSFQKIIFFPTLYSEIELENWGKQWVEHIFNPKNND